MLTASPTWKALQRHYETISKMHLRQLFAEDRQRFDNYSVHACDLLLDYSKNRVTEETMELLFNLARQADIKGWTEKMFTGHKINLTENRAVLHVALRNRSNRPILVNGKDVMPEIKAVLKRKAGFSDTVPARAWKGY